MASIIKRGPYQFQATIRIKGFPSQSKTFESKREAEAWATIIESEMIRGVFVQQEKEAEQTSLRTALERYRDEIVPLKRHPYQEIQRINRWLQNGLCNRSLASLRGVDFVQYRDKRRRDGRAENTIRLELQLINHLFEIARKEWGMEQLANPLNNIRKPGNSNARSRRLEAGEYARIHEELSKSSNRYAAPAFDLAIETSLRKGTPFKLRWEWVDLSTRMIRFPANMLTTANKGIPAVLPLSSHAVAVLRSLRTSDEQPKQGLVLDTTANAIGIIWHKCLKKLGITGLRWHDLRHEAASRLFEKGLHPGSCQHHRPPKHADAQKVHAFTPGKLAGEAGLTKTQRLAARDLLRYIHSPHTALGGITAKPVGHGRLTLLLALAKNGGITHEKKPHFSGV